MINDEELKKIQSYAKQAVEDGGRGVAITLAMDPVVMFAITTELLRLRRMRTAFKYAVDPEHYEQIVEACDDR